MVYFQNTHIINYAILKLFLHEAMFAILRHEKKRDFAKW